MNTQELINDVRYNLTRSNERDYTDSEIQRNIDNEYYMLQEKLKRAWKVEWTGTELPTIYDLTPTSSFINTDPNLHIERVEVSADGGENWRRITRTTYHDYNLTSSGACSCQHSLTDALADTSCTKHFIQTAEGLHIFPIPDSGIQVKVYARDDEVIDWNDPSFVPRLPRFAHRLLTLKAAMMYRDLEDTNELQFIFNEYNTLMAEFTKLNTNKGKVAQMKNKQCKRFI